MAYTTIDPTRYDADSPITESLMTDIIGNIESIRGQTWVELTGTGSLNTSSIDNLIVIVVGGGGGGGHSGSGPSPGVVGDDTPGAGGGSGCVIEKYIDTSATSSISYACGSGGAGSTTAGVDGSAGGNTTFGSITASGGTGGGSGANGTTGDGTGSKKTDSLNTAGADGDVTGAGASLDLGLVACFGTPGTSTQGGGGAPLTLHLQIDSSSVGSGGNGGNSSNGSNATGNGAGGGGGGQNIGGGQGGNGSAGIVFYQIIE